MRAVQQDELALVQPSNVPILLDPCLTGALDHDDERVVAASTYLLRGVRTSDCSCLRPPPLNA